MKALVSRAVQYAYRALVPGFEAGTDFLGPLPVEIQQVTVFSSGVPTGAADPAAAKALMEPARR